MAPIKFEENMKETLENRTMSPSSELWSKLSERLDNDEKSKKKPVYLWLGIAASVAALIMISVVYFNKDIEAPVEDILVEETPKQDIIKEALRPNETIKTEELAVEDSTSPEVEEEVVLPVKQKEEKKQSPVKNQLFKAPVTSQEAVTEVKPVEQLQELKAEKLTFDKAEVDKAVAEVLKFKDDKNTVTEQQIDSLLKSAQRELFKDRIFKNSTNVVDADALLQDVEDDLGLSFRTKVYEALKDGYEKAKTAVANRNN